MFTPIPSFRTGVRLVLIKWRKIGWIKLKSTKHDPKDPKASQVVKSASGDKPPFESFDLQESTLLVLLL